MCYLIRFYPIFEDFLDFSYLQEAFLILFQRFQKSNIDWLIFIELF